MAREIVSRFRLSGTLIARTPLHVGGHGDDVDTDLPLARNGAGELYVPGTSLAGSLRQWCERAFDEDFVNTYWGYQEGDNGHASYIVVDDLTINEAVAVAVEVRDGVGIDRQWGAAAEHIKYDRAILPRGTRMTGFCLTADVSNPGDRDAILAMLAALRVALERSRVRLGAAKTRGLGRIELRDATLTEETLGTRKGILAVLRNPGVGTSVNEVDLTAARQISPPRLIPRLEVVIRWMPVGPLMIKAGFDGIAVDMLPLVSAIDGGIGLVLPGSSVKGAFRTQAERIVRTLLNRATSGERDTKKKFLRDLEVPLVDNLFGIRGLSEDDVRKRPHNSLPASEPLQGLAALSVDDCFASQALSRRQWQDIQSAQSDGELRNALTEAGLESWAEAYHLAVDRWTGAAAESMLYSVLEPHRVEWEPLSLEIDFDRLAQQLRLPAVALLLLVLRDLAQNRLPLGFGTHRGMGAVAVESVMLAAHDCEAPLNGLNDVMVSRAGLAGVPAKVNADWEAWIAENGPGGLK